MPLLLDRLNAFVADPKAKDIFFSNTQIASDTFRGSELFNEALKGNPGLAISYLSDGIRVAKVEAHTTQAAALSANNSTGMANPFRKNYRKLTSSEIAIHDAIKNEAGNLYYVIMTLPNSRDRSLAITALEDCVMRAVRALTA